MAIRTKTAVEFEGGACVWQYDWDDVTLKLKAFRCTNDTASSTRGTLTSQSTGDSQSKVVAPGEHWEMSIPTLVANRFDLRVDSHGRLDGLDHNFEFPA